MTAIIEATEIRKRYEQLTAVDGVSFRVEKGECYGLLGPNGAGKTTIIRMIYGFSPLSSGELRVFGLDIRKEWREIRSRIGVCQQHNALDPDLSVQENLLVFARYFRMDPAEARKRSEELLQFFALGSKRNARVMELSGGLERRVTVARAMINRPDIVILDEPTTGLDPQSRHQLWDRLRELRRSGITLLLTTHYMEEASRLCSRLMILDHGRILVEGSPEALVRGHVGTSVVEVEGAEQGLLQFLIQKGVRHDITERRVLIYADNSVSDEIRKRFCTSRCTFRDADLEDVFLQMTGRELRE